MSTVRPMPGLAAAAVVAALAGCASHPVPTLQMDSAARAIEEARDAAQDDLAPAREKLALARRLAATDARDVALWLAEQALVDAELARAKARAAAAGTARRAWERMTRVDTLERAARFAFSPRTNGFLEKVRALESDSRSDAALMTLAPTEMARAVEAFEAADAAWRTLQDPAWVDHLAYMARQRLAIARATAVDRSAFLVRVSRPAAPQDMCWPPLIAMLAPVRNAASSEAR